MTYFDFNGRIFGNIQIGERAGCQARAPALDAAVSTLEVPGLGEPYGLLVLADGTRLVGTMQNRLQLLTPAGLLATLGGGDDDDDDDDGVTLVDGKVMMILLLFALLLACRRGADCDNGRLRKIVGRQVTTLAGGSKAGTADGAGAGARFKEPWRLPLDERGRLLVAECGRAGMLRVVDASLAPSVWMGPVDAAAEAAAQAQEERWRKKLWKPRSSKRTTASWWRRPSWRTWCWWWRGSASQRTATCWRRGASTFGGCCCRGCRRGVGSSRSRWGR
jgi:hypothetical protein